MWFIVQHDPGSTSLFILEQHSNQPIRFTFYVKLRLTTRVRCFYISVIHISFPSDFRDNLWVGLSLVVGMGMGLNPTKNFRTGMLFQDQQHKLIQEHVALGKIMVTVHMMVFLPTENSRSTNKMCKGVKTVPGIPPLHTQMKMPVLNCNGRRNSYDETNQVCLNIVLYRVRSFDITSCFWFV